MDDFKFDALGLDDSFESSVVAADVELELLFKLWAAGAPYCTGFIPLSLLLRTQARINKRRRPRQYINAEKNVRSLLTEREKFLPHWEKETRTSR